MDLQAPDMSAEEVLHGADAVRKPFTPPQITPIEDTPALMSRRAVLHGLTGAAVAMHTMGLVSVTPPGHDDDDDGWGRGRGRGRSRGREDDEPRGDWSEDWDDWDDWDDDGPGDDDDWDDWSGDEDDAAGYGRRRWDETGPDDWGVPARGQERGGGSGWNDLKDGRPSGLRGRQDLLDGSGGGLDPESWSQPDRLNDPIPPKGRPR